MADWLIAIGLPDPMSDRRRTYSTRAEYRALVKGEGGLLASCERRFGAIGLKESEEPKAGDVALIAAPFAVRNRRVLSQATGAICVSRKMLAIITSGNPLAVAAFPIVRAWGLIGA